LSLPCESTAADTTAIRSINSDRSRFDVEFGLGSSIRNVGRFITMAWTVKHQGIATASND
jgi:hypothetical protein